MTTKTTTKTDKSKTTKPSKVVPRKEAPPSEAKASPQTMSKATVQELAKSVLGEARAKGDAPVEAMLKRACKIAAPTVAAFDNASAEAVETAIEKLLMEPKREPKAKREPKPVDATQPEAVAHPSAVAEPTAEPKPVSERRIANALRTLSSERRLELFAEAFGRPAPKTATVTAVCACLALVLSVRGLPEDVQAKCKSAPAKSGGKSNGGGVRKFGWMSLMREMAVRPNGVSMTELVAEGAAKGVAASKVSGDEKKLKTQLVMNLKRHGFPLEERDGRLFHVAA